MVRGFICPSLPIAICCWKICLNHQKSFEWYTNCIFFLALLTPISLNLPLFTFNISLQVLIWKYTAFIYNQKYFCKTSHRWESDILSWTLCYSCCQYYFIISIDRLFSFWLSSLTIFLLHIFFLCFISLFRRAFHFFFKCVLYTFTHADDLKKIS